MKRKVLLLVTIIFSIFFIGIANVNAEEYQVGDLVEIINPSGGANARFYYVGSYKSGMFVNDIPYLNENDIFLVTSTPAISNKTFGEFSNSIINDDYLSVMDNNYKYLMNMNNVNLFSEVLDHAFSFMEANTQDENIIYSMIKKFDHGWVSYKNMCSSCEFKIGYIDTSVSDNNYFKYLTFADRESLDNDTTKLNYYYTFRISKENESIIRKVSDSSNKSETKTISSSVQAESHENNKISNPKTSDMNIYIALLVIGLFTGIIIVSSKRLKKIK